MNEDVYELLKKIPAGKVTTYGDLAKALGNPSASRNSRQNTRSESKSNPGALSQGSNV